MVLRQSTPDSRDGITSPQSVLLLVSFAACGFGCALPGALLPALLHSWQWSDARAGVMLMIVSAMAALAAMTVRFVARFAIALGHLLIAFGAWMWALHQISPLLAAGSFGLGLGMSMSGISLAAARRSANSGRVLARLNAVWAVGACISPPLMTHALRMSAPRGLLLAVSATFFVLALLLAGFVREQHAAQHAGVPASVRGVPAPLLLATALATGIEASCGGWLAAYVQRSHHRLESVVLAPSLFWAGLLLSRLIAGFSWKGRLDTIPARRLAALAFAGLIVVLLASSDVILAGASFMIGFGLGPLYPELLARVLRIKENSGIFTMAGATPAMMTYLTGQLSSASSSLRIGLCVPLAGAALMLMLLWLSQKVRTPAPMR